MTKIIKTLVVLGLVVVILYVVYLTLFGAVGQSDTLQVFIVPQETAGFNAANDLYNQHLIKNVRSFQWLRDVVAGGAGIKPGGYKLSTNMNMLTIISHLTGKQDLMWVTLSYCPRKEQVGEKLAGVLGWTADQLNTWNMLYKVDKPEYFEGVYYPDTYLLPVDESPAQIAKRFIDRFNQKFTPLADQYVAKNIKWTTGVKIASLIAREAAGKEDMHIIAGIIWNRLDTNMRLQIDSTMQYTLGKRDGSWWGPVDLAQKQSESPYNTYLHEGLPPTPICSPNIDYLEAALNPAETDCLYYLHDSGGQIHCAKTYAAHKANIAKYL